MAKGTIRRIPTVARKKRLSAAHVNLVGEHINRQITGFDAPFQRIDPGDDPSQLSLQRFKIVSVEGDYLVCVTFNGVTAGTTNINVAKPLELRTSFTEANGVTYVYTDSSTRTASVSGEDDETQVIIPAYVVDGQIWAVKNPGGGTGAVGPATTAAPSGRPLVWMDLNMGARAFAKQAD